MNLFSLEGKRIVVTGASSGIGRACAIQASKMGAGLILTARRQDALSETLSLCEGSSHSILVGDIASHEFVANLVLATGRIDGLVHSAGIGPMCSIGFIDDSLEETVFKTNYFSFLELMKHYSKAKNRNSKLSVVAISSVAAKSGWGGVSVYSGSKGALNASMRALAMELAPKGIRVNVVCPSNIKTPMYDAGSVEMNGEESLKRLLDQQPLGLGEPEQVANAVVFLLSDAASFITGVELPVDGGYLAR